MSNTWLHVRISLTKCVTVVARRKQLIHAIITTELLECDLFWEYHDFSAYICVSARVKHARIICALHYVTIVFEKMISYAFVRDRYRDSQTGEERKKYAFYSMLFLSALINALVEMILFNVCPIELIYHSK